MKSKIERRIQETRQTLVQRAENIELQRRINTEMALLQQAIFNIIDDERDAQQKLNSMVE